MRENATSDPRAIPSNVLRLLLAVLVAGGLAWPTARASAQEGTAVPESGGTPAAGGGLAVAVTWLLGQQTEDGGFPGFDGTSDPGTTCDAIYALAAAGESGLDVAEPLERAYAFLAEAALEYALVGTGQSAKIVLAAVAVGEDPSDVGGVLPLELIRQGVNAETGLYGSGVFDHALAILALAAVGESVPEAAFEVLAATQLADGSWAFDGTTTEGAGDSNTTALVIQALVAAGQSESPLILPAIRYLAVVQAESGAYPYASGGEPDANSTALAVQALIAVGFDPAAFDLLNPLGALVAFQNPSGAFRYQDSTPDDNLFATVQAIPALAGLALPVGAEGAP